MIPPRCPRSKNPQAFWSFAIGSRSVDILVREFRGLSSPQFKNSVELHPLHWARVKPAFQNSMEALNSMNCHTPNASGKVLYTPAVNNYHATF